MAAIDVGCSHLPPRRFYELESPAAKVVVAVVLAGPFAAIVLRERRR